MFRGTMLRMTADILDTIQEDGGITSKQKTCQP